MLRGWAPQVFQRFARDERPHHSETLFVGASLERPDLDFESLREGTSFLEVSKVRGVALGEQVDVGIPKKAPIVNVAIDDHQDAVRVVAEMSKRQGKRCDGA